MASVHDPLSHSFVQLYPTAQVVTLFPMAVIQALFVYPIKGCMGVPVQTAAVTKTGRFVVEQGQSHRRAVRAPSKSDAISWCCVGLPYDRQWMVVREGTGKFITQRQIPKLCKVSCLICNRLVPVGCLWMKLPTSHDSWSSCLHQSARCVRADGVSCIHRCMVRT